MKHSNLIIIINVTLFGIIFSRLLDLSNENKLLLFIPQFERSEIEPTETSCYVVFQSLLWYNHDITYILSYSEMNVNNWENDEYLFSYPRHLTKDLWTYLINTESLWKPWTEIAISSRIYNLQTLTAGSFYRIKYQIKSKYSISQNSQIHFIPLKKTTDTVSLYVRGTGRNNHNNAQVRFNNKIIFSNGKYQGLALIVLSRLNLKVKSIQYFDTYNMGKETDVKTITYDKYSYDTNGNVISESVTIQITKEFQITQSSMLYDAIQSLKKSDIFILVSCYGWEKYFTYELAEFLTQHGALKIKELNYAFYQSNNENKFDYESLLDYNHYHHPYAFVGIPLIGISNGFEVLQTNKGHYLSTNNLPYAEILISLSFDEMLRSYSFSPQQKHKDHYRLLNYPYLHNPLDMSLKNLFPLLMNSNLKTSINGHFNIFEKNTGIDHLMTGYTGCYKTEYDRATLGPNICPIKTFFNGDIYQLGTSIEEQWYFPFFYSYFEKQECVPPYIPNGIECVDPTKALTSTASIIQCKIGLAPQLCSFNEDNVNYFNGY